MFELTGKERSPLEALSKLRFGGRTFAVESIVSVALTRTTLFRNNPNRVYVRFLNEGANDVRVSIDGNVSITSGFLLVANGGMISLTWEEDAESVGYEHYAIAVGAACNVRVHEVIRI